MRSETEMLERSVLELLRRKFEADGYSFIAYPSSDLLPKELSGYRPDALAVKDGKFTLIEVKRSKNKASEIIASNISKVLEGFPDWSFELYYQDKVESPGGDFEIASKEEILDGLANVSRLVEEKHYDAAFVLYWSVIEAASRSLMPRFGYAIRPTANLRDIITFLEQFGIVDTQQAKNLRDCLSLRHSIVHGFKHFPTTKADCQSLAEIVSSIVEEM